MCRSKGRCSILFRNKRSLRLEEIIKSGISYSISVKFSQKQLDILYQKPDLCSKEIFLFLFLLLLVLQSDSEYHSHKCLQCSLAHIHHHHNNNNRFFNKVFITHSLNADNDYWNICSIAAAVIYTYIFNVA